MLSAYCPAHGSTMLFSPSSIIRMVSTPLGIEVEVECYCGAHIEFLTGRSAREPRLAAGV